MAAPIIKVKRSSVAGKIPTIAGLELGEFAINTYDGKVYIEQDQGGVGVGTTIVVVNPWSVGLGSTSFNTYFTNGSVGIGTTNPQKSLHIAGVGTQSGGIRLGDLDFFAFGTGGNSGSPTFRNSQTNGSTTLRVLPNGTGNAQFEFFGTDYFQNTNAWDNVRIVSSSTEFRIDSSYAPAGIAKPIRIETNVSGGGGVFNNPYQLYLDTNGNIGIGTSTTFAKFNVQGNTYVSGSVGIGTTLPKAALNVVGVVSATSFFGDGSGLTNLSFSNASQWVTTSAGIHTLSAVGVGTTNPNAVVTSTNTTVLAAGIVTAYKFYGDGSNLTGVVANAYVSTSATPPSSPSAGSLWYSTVLGRTFVYYDDGDSSQWVDTAPFNLQGSGAATVSVGATAPTGPSDGDLWYNSNYGRLFVYYKDGDSDQWVDAAPFNYSGITTSTYTENSFVATSGQTTFSVTYDIGYVDVYLNGIRLSSSEYTAADGTSIVLNEAAALGDVIDIIEVATNRGPTGPQGPTGTTTLAGVGTTSGSTVHYPVFIAGLGSSDPYISTTSNYFSFIPSSGTLSVNQLNIPGISTFSGGPVLIGGGTSTGISSQRLQVTGGAYISDNLGIGKTNPEYNLHIVGTSDPAGMFFDAYGNVASNIAGRRANGTVSSPTGVIANDNLLVIQGGGYNGTSFADAKAVIFMQASEVWSSTAQGTHIDFATTLPGTTTRSNKLRIDGHGNILVGTSSSTGTASQRLQVTGGGYFSGRVGIGSTNPQETLDVQGGNGFIRIGETFSGYNGITLNNSTVDNNYNILSSPSDLNLYLNRPSGGWDIKFRLANNDQMVLNSSGNLGINSTSPTSRLDVVGDAKVSGVVTATDFNSTSDINLKTNIKPIDDPLEKIIQLNGVSFDWKHMNQSSAGVIAQDVEKVLPEIVRNDVDGYKSLNYNGLIGLLIEAVKEQNETIKSLEQKINTLEGRLG